MTLLECLQTFLTGDSTLVAFLPGGIRPQFVPQNTAIPLLVVRIISGASEPPTHDAGASPWTRARVELTAWGGDIKVCEQIYLRLVTILKSFNGYLGGSSNGRFATSFLYGPRTLQDESTRMVGVQMDVVGMMNVETLS